MQLDQSKIEEAITSLIIGMGEDPTAEPYLGTPNRFYRYLKEIFGDESHNFKTFPEESYEGPITIQGHEIWSLCPHHLLPVRLLIDASYVPRGGMVLGLSKLPRLINHVVKEGPALQERVTQRIIEVLKPYATHASVAIKGDHLCTKMRGVKSSGSMITQASWSQPNSTLSTTQSSPIVRMEDSSKAVDVMERSISHEVL